MVEAFQVCGIAEFEGSGRHVNAGRHGFCENVSLAAIGGVVAPVPATGASPFGG